MEKDRKAKGLFITDFDGTLLRSDGTLASRDLEALVSLKRCGIRTAVATGRSLYSFNNSPGVGLPVDYVIFTTGAGVVAWPQGNLIYRVNISADMVAQTLAFFRDTAFDFMLHRPVPDNHRFVYRRTCAANPDFETRLERYRQFGTPLNTDGRNGFGEASQFLAVVPREETREALQAIRSRVPWLSVIHTTSPLDHASTWVELFHPDVSKSRTASWLTSALGVDPGATMAVGNDYNDRDLLEWAAESYVVRNAPGDLKRRFTTVASHDEGGVAEAIAQWKRRPSMAWCRSK